MLNLINVSSYDEVEAKREKTPSVFSEYAYDNDTGVGILALFDESMFLFKSIKNDIKELNDLYKKLMRMYDEFTDFDQAMNSIINAMNNRIEAAENAFLNIVSTAQQAIASRMENDTTLISDLNNINDMLIRNNMSLKNDNSKAYNEASYRPSSNDNKHVNNVVSAYAAAAQMNPKEERNVDLHYESYDDWISGK